MGNNSVVWNQANYMVSSISLFPALITLDSLAVIQQFCIKHAQKAKQSCWI